MVNMGESLTLVEDVSPTKSTHLWLIWEMLESGPTTHKASRGPMVNMGDVGNYG